MANADIIALSSIILCLHPTSVSPVEVNPVFVHRQ